MDRIIKFIGKDILNNNIFVSSDYESFEKKYLDIITDNEIEQLFYKTRVYITMLADDFYLIEKYRDRDSYPWYFPGFKTIEKLTPGDTLSSHGLPNVENLSDVEKTFINEINNKLDTDGLLRYGDVFIKTRRFKNKIIKRLKKLNLTQSV